MKKILLSLIGLLIISQNAFALNFGMYKPEEDYGLIDGFKLNFSKQDRKDAGNKFVQLKQEVPGEKERMKKEKEKYNSDRDRKDDEEYQIYKFMLDNTVAF